MQPSYPQKRDCSAAVQHRPQAGSTLNFGRTGWHFARLRLKYAVQEARDVALGLWR